jgi:hypothetical protein
VLSHLRWVVGLGLSLLSHLKLLTRLPDNREKHLALRAKGVRFLHEETK